jgi:hypothetical protein
MPQTGTPPPYVEILNNKPLSRTQRQNWQIEAKDLMETTLDKWTYPAIPLTTIENIRDSAMIAAQLAKIWALAQSDPKRDNDADVQYHMERLWHHFDQANAAAAAHSEAAWQYSLQFVSWLHE